MNAITNSSIITKAGNHVEAVVDDEVVLMHIDDGKFFSLNKTSQRAWELLDEDICFGDLVSKIRAEYSVTQETCEEDMRDFMKNLLERTLIKIK